MSHPVGTHISKEQDHELDHWLKNHVFRETKENREVLCDLIDTAKIACGKTSNQHLTHKELNKYFSDNAASWIFE